MQASRPSVLGIGLLAVVLLCGGCKRAPTPDAAPTQFNPNGTPVVLSGPYTHETLTVFLIHSDQQDERAFLTLDEGLQTGMVSIAEQDRASVNSLVIENQSDRPLFLQEGERLEGGRQDRTIRASLVIAAHSGKTTVPTFCIEHNRWVPGANGKAFAAAANTALAPKGVRGAAKFEGEQDKVWDTVAVQKQTAVFALSARNVTSSANELFDSPKVQTLSHEAAEAFRDLLPSHPDAVGAVLVVNGRIEEADVYPNHDLAARLVPRLIESYAVQAAMLKEQTPVADPSRDDVARFMQGGAEKSKRDEAIDARNTMQVRELDGAAFDCETRYDGQVVHRQVMKKNGTGAGNIRGSALGTDW